MTDKELLEEKLAEEQQEKAFEAFKGQPNIIKATKELLEKSGYDSEKIDLRGSYIATGPFLLPALFGCYLVSVYIDKDADISYYPNGSGRSSVYCPTERHYYNRSICLYGRKATVADYIKNHVEIPYYVEIDIKRLELLHKIGA